MLKPVLWAYGALERKLGHTHYYYYYYYYDSLQLTLIQLK
jgi:hypothetical protein